jgi:hypothetical protein
MLPPRADNDRVGTGLAWGVVFSLCFHMVLFSPQLAFQLMGQLKPAESAPEKAKEKERSEAQRKADERKTPEERKKEEEERKKEAANPEAKKKSAAQQPPEPPQPELQPLLTPTPSPALPDVEDVAIGQDDGDSMSVVIIGREDYEEHMARQSVVAQAGFRMSDAGGNGEQDYGRGTEGNAGGGGGGAPNAQSNTTTATTAGAPVAPEATRIASAPPAPKPPEEPKPEEAPKPPEQPPAVVAEATPKPVPPVPPTTTTPVNEPPQPAPPTPTVPVTANPEAEPNPPLEAPRDPKVLPPVEPKPAPPPPAPEPVKQPTPTVPVEPKPAPPPPANQPPKAPEGGGIASTERPKTDAKDKAPGESGKAGGKGPSTVPGTGGKGELKDLESPATSLTEVDPKLWKNGRLVAAQGITLKPREPRFTTLQTVSQLPNCRPPVVSLTFDRTGSCIDVFFNLPTGDPEIDGVIKNSLFFWRAAGKKIDSLKEGEKVRVTLRLLL